MLSSKYFKKILDYQFKILDYYRLPLPRMSTRWDELHAKYSVELIKLGKNVSSSEPNMNPVDLVGCPKLEACTAAKQRTDEKGQRALNSCGVKTIIH